MTRRSSNHRDHLTLIGFCSILFPDMTYVWFVERRQASSVPVNYLLVVIDVHVSTVTQCHSFAISVCNANWCCLAMGLVASLPPQARGTVCCEPRVHGGYHAGVSEHFLNVLLASCRGSRPSYWLPALLHKLVLRTANWMDQHVRHSVRC